MQYTKMPKLLNCAHTSMSSNPVQQFTGLLFPSSSSIMNFSIIRCGYHA